MGSFSIKIDPINSRSLRKTFSDGLVMDIAVLMELYTPPTTILEDIDAPRDGRNVFH